MRVCGRDGAEEVGAVEFPGVEKVGGLAPGFQFAGAEGDDVGGYAGF